jgi:CelD/BcsL family acetyltransferase involved in cellulose biosynthesis
MPGAAHVIRGLEAFESLRVAWTALAQHSGARVFQQHGWLLAWYRHIAPRSEPWILVSGDPPASLLPLALHRRSGLRWLTAAGHGVSDYVGPVGVDKDACAALGKCLAQAASDFDAIDLRGLSLDDERVSSLLEAVGLPGRSRPYEACPLIDTTGSWENYLATRRKKFRANLKRTARQVQAYGSPLVQIEPPSVFLFEELLDVERASWKWHAQSAFLQAPPRRAFLREILLETNLPFEIWTCRLDSDLAAFALILLCGQQRLYYLPSFRSQYPDVGAYLLSEIVRSSFLDSCARFDFLQGDEGYKKPWSTSQVSVHEYVFAGRRPLSRAVLCGFDLRWRLARSDSLRAFRRMITRAA